jgi:hypothetical protein
MRVHANRNKVDIIAPKGKAASLQFSSMSRLIFVDEA